MIDAAGKGELSTVIRLLDEGVDVNFQWPEGGGETALFDATCNGRQDVVRLLISRGADVRIKNDEGKVAQDYAQTSEMKKLFAK